MRPCWIVLPPFRNVYVFTSPNDYQVFKANETLHDPVLDVSFPLQGVFE